MFYTVLLIGIGLSVVPGGFAIDIVRDRQDRMRHQLRVSGVTSLEYWGAYLLTNSGIMLFSVVFAIVLALATHVAPLTGPALPSFIISGLLYIPVNILFSFAVSFGFDNADACQSVWPALNNFLGFIPYIIVGTVDGFQKVVLAKALHYAFAVLVPPYTMLGVLYYSFRVSVVSQSSLVGSSLTVADYWDPDNVIMPTILIMLLHLAIWPGLIYLFENWSQLRERFSPVPTADDDDDDEGEEDDDVVEERSRALAPVEAGAAPDIRLQRLRKVGR